MGSQVESSETPSVDVDSRHAAIQACPPEIIHFITHFLDFSSVLNLRLTSQTLHSIVTPTALRNVTLLARQNSWNAEGIQSRLSTCNLNVAVRNDQDRHTETPASLPLPNLYAHAEHLIIYANSVKVYETVYHSDLPAVFATLKKLRSLRSLALIWDLPRDRASESSIFVFSLLEAICASVLVATNARLEQLTINPRLITSNATIPGPHIALSAVTTPSTFPKSLLEVRGLKKLVLNGGGGCWSRVEWNERPIRHRVQRASSDSDGQPKCCLAKVFEDGVRRIVEKNPGIEDLSFEYRCAASDFTWDTLGVSGHGHTLERLTLYGVAFPRALRDVPHFGKLTHIAITTPSNSQSLTSIQTAQVTPSFIDFLRSFTGLKTLIIDLLERDGLSKTAPHSLLTLGREFFTKALPNHAPTLQYLSISFAEGIHNVPGWMYSPSYFVPNFSQMSSLRHLALFPSPVDEDTDPEVAFAAYQSILDGIDDSCSIASILAKTSPQLE
ncbi:hypothetical protein AX16_007056 [Volvariella volvacea WC 439]|nr:hypothetical protein AX16_007056 [Volvariella volvacea WC 439]